KTAPLAVGEIWQSGRFNVLRTHSNKYLHRLAVCHTPKKNWQLTNTLASFSPPFELHKSLSGNTLSTMMRSAHQDSILGFIRYIRHLPADFRQEFHQFRVESSWIAHVRSVASATNDHLSAILNGLDQPLRLLQGNRAIVLSPNGQ